MAQHGQVILVVVSDEDQRRRRDERDLLDQLRRDADVELVHIREALAGGEARPAVDDDGAESHRPPEGRQRHGDMAGAHHQEDRGRGEDLDEDPHAFEEERPGSAGLEREGRLGGKPAIEEGTAQRPLLGPGVQEQQLGPVLGRVEAGEDGGAPAALGMGARFLVEDQRRVGVVQRHRLEEDLDGAAAGEADLPGLLIAQVQLEQSRRVPAEHVGRLLDDLGVHATADRDRAEDAPALAHDHLGALLPRRGPPRVHQRGHRHLGFLALELLDVLEEFAHGFLSARLIAGSDGSPGRAGWRDCGPPRNGPPAAAPPPSRA